MIRYANCWEDPLILIDAFKPLNPQSILSIGSAGDNSFALLTLNPGRVTAVDFSYEQIHLIRLKKAAIEVLEYDELLGFLGIRESKIRKTLFNTKIIPLLESDTARYWLDNMSGIEKGVIHTGKFERYFTIFRKFLLPFVVPGRRIKELLAPKTLHEQELFYKTVFTSFVWKNLFKWYFSRKTMGKIGRDKAFFNYVDGPIEQSLYNRAEYGLTRISTSTNPFLEYICTGTFTRNLPLYLDPQYYPLIKNNISKLEIRYGTVNEVLETSSGCYDCFNMSDIFEYMDPDKAADSFNAIVAHSAKKARLIYWNMQVDRKICHEFAEPLTGLSEEAFLRDRAFFYKKLHIEEITIAHNTE